MTNRCDFAAFAEVRTEQTIQVATQELPTDLRADDQLIDLRLLFFFPFQQRTLTFTLYLEVSHFPGLFKGSTTHLRLSDRDVQFCQLELEFIVFQHTDNLSLFDSLTATSSQLGQKPWAARADKSQWIVLDDGRSGNLPGPRNEHEH